MGITLNDIRTVMGFLQREEKFFSQCQSKYRDFNEEYLEQNADKFSKDDWMIISYFTAFSEKFLVDFKVELDSALVNKNKKMDYFLKKKYVVEGVGYRVDCVLRFNRNVVFKLLVKPSGWV